MDLFHWSTQSESDQSSDGRITNTPLKCDSSDESLDGVRDDFQRPTIKILGRIFENWISLTQNCTEYQGDSDQHQCLIHTVNPSTVRCVRNRGVGPKLGGHCASFAPGCQRFPIEETSRQLSCSHCYRRPMVQRAQIIPAKWRRRCQSRYARWRPSTLVRD
jgi:hypothetical protein